MGDTDGPIRQPRPEPECSTLRETYYRPLVRLAALLTGDADAAEAVACDALTALRTRSPFAPEPSPDALRYLQQQVLVRSRHNRRSGSARTAARWARRGGQPVGPAAGSGLPGPTGPSPADFARLPVVLALQGLPPRGREAVVLTHYLDLSEQQAALVAGVTPAALRRLLSQAMRTLDRRLPQA